MMEIFTRMYWSVFCGLDGSVSGPGKNEWSLIAAGLPAAIILLVSVAASYPLLGAVRTVLSANVLILLGLGAFGARKAGYRPFQAAALGIADAAFGLLVIAANALLK
jgi:hypothetical protein